MGFYPPDALVHEAQRRGVRIAPPDANRSRVLCHVERGAGRAGSLVRIGLGYVKGVRGEEMEALVGERERGGPYRGSPTWPRARGRAATAWSGWPGRARWTSSPARVAGRRRRRTRREALWGSGVAGDRAARGAGTQLALPLEPPEPPELEPLGDWEEMIADYRSTGMALGEHPMALLRAGLGPRAAAQQRPGEGRGRREVEVAGMVVARQRPETAKGIVFMLLEDERGTVNLIVPPPVYDRHRALVRAAPLRPRQGPPRAPRRHHQRPRQRGRRAAPRGHATPRRAPPPRASGHPAGEALLPATASAAAASRGEKRRLLALFISPYARRGREK